jgi:putative NADPH-quinone reductase
MKRRILVIDGHPDASDERFIHAMTAAYSVAAKRAGHEVKVIKLAEFPFPPLQTAEDFLHSDPPAAIRRAQVNIAWCNHLLILYPLWLGSMPSLLKAFFEQVMRPGFAFKNEAGGKLPKKLLQGKSARIVVTMGMPALFYKWHFRAHSLKSLERNILAFVGVGPIRANVIGGVETMSAKQRDAWLATLRRYAAAGK